MKENKGSIKKFWPQGLFRFDGLSKWRNSGAQMKAIQSANLSLCNNSSRASRVAVALLAFFTIGSLFAQGAPGTIQGRILDSGTGDPMIGVTAFIREANVFGVTDIDGNYVIPDVPPGQHTVVFQMAGYETSQEVITMAAGGFEELNITMSYKTAKEVVVKAKRVSNTAAFLLTQKKKAVAAQDAISSEQISKSPDSDAGDAVKRVTGITLVDGKFIYVRGLGERYTTVTFNGAQVPSPEPDKRVVPLNIFPVGVLDSLVISKTYTADMYGEFTGGLLQINSKDFPSGEKLKVGLSSGYNSLTTFQNANSFNRNTSGFLGFHDSSNRNMPSLLDSIANKANPNFYTKTELNTFGQQFGTTQWTPSVNQVGLPIGLSAEYGNFYSLTDGSKLGFSLTGLLKNKYAHVDETLTTFRINGDVADNFVIKEDNYSTTKSSLLTLGYSPNNTSKYKLTAMLSQMSADEVRVAEGINDEYGTNTKQTIAENTINTVWISQLNGENAFDFLDSAISYGISVSKANRFEPDSRFTFYVEPELGEEKQVIESPDEGPSRFFSDHNEYVTDIRADYVIPYKQWDGLKSKFLIGGQFFLRSRASDTRRFRFLNISTNASLQNVLTSPMEEILIPANIDYDNAIRLVEYTEATDSYSGNHIIGAGYISTDIPVMQKVRFVPGIRYENSDMQVKTFDQFASGDKKTSIIQTNNILPSANLIYSPTKQFNIRFAGSQTVARPDFKEMSPFRFSDVVSRRTFFGAGSTALNGLGFSSDLKETKSINGDLRFEWFPSAAEVVALSGFYKKISDPLELVSFRSGSSYASTVTNIEGGAFLYGAEFEFSYNLGNLTGIEFLNIFTASTNLAYIYSEIKITATSELTNSKRPLQGQSPYVVNLNLDTNLEDLGLNYTIMYNVYGPRMLEAGTSGLDDFYEQPNGRLDMSLKKEFADNFSAKLTVGNLTDAVRKITQGLDSNKIYKSQRTGVSVGFGLNYAI